MITRALAVVLAITLALLGWGEYRVVQARAEAAGYLALTQVQKSALEGQERALRASRAALAARIKAQDRLRKQLKDSNDALSAALAANKAWADRPLPDGIADWVRQPSESPGNHEGYTPADPPAGLP